MDICHHFLRDMVKYKDIYIQYIWSEDNPSYIMIKKSSAADFVRHMKRTTEGEIWEIVDTGRENIKNTRVTDYVINYEKNEYYIHALAEVMNGYHKSNWILI